MPGFYSGERHIEREWVVSGEDNEMLKAARFKVLASIGVLIVGVSIHSRAQNTAPIHPAATSGSHSTAQDLGTVTQAMGEHSEHDHHMGPHMKMSTLRAPQPGDSERAQQIVDSAKAALEKYKDVKVAEADGFKIFRPTMKQKMYHFTNFRYAMEAGFHFNPEHPTSLLYQKTGADSFQLIGAMYTAPARFSEDELNKRVPLSVAQWHQHVNLCRPPKGQEREQASGHPKFGLAGSISTKEECEAAGGTFYPRIFGWMVHLYPNEQTIDAIWSVEHQKSPMDMFDMHH